MLIGAAAGAIACAARQMRIGEADPVGATAYFYLSVLFTSACYLPACLRACVPTILVYNLYKRLLLPPTLACIYYG